MARVDGWLSARISRLSNLHERTLLVLASDPPYVMAPILSSSSGRQEMKKLYAGMGSQVNEMLLMNHRPPTTVVEKDRFNRDARRRDIANRTSILTTEHHQSDSTCNEGDKSGMEQGSGSKKGSRSKTRGNGASEDQTICKARDDPDAYLKWVHLGLKWVDDVGAFWG
ncbi:hypothetical protein Tco_1326756 [Tanacetum coccineum]